jgi:hypothetical protein
MKKTLLMIVLLLTASAAMGQEMDNAGHVRAGKAEIYKAMTPIEGEQAPTWTSFPADVIQPGCVQFTRCRAYTVFAYYGDWRNEYGNEGLFVLRFKNVWITAFCSGKPGSCPTFVESVGQTIWLDDEITDLIFLRGKREPQQFSSAPPLTSFAS